MQRNATHNIDSDSDVSGFNSTHYVPKPLPKYNNELSKIFTVLFSIYLILVFIYLAIALYKFCQNRLTKTKSRNNSYEESHNADNEA